MRGFLHYTPTSGICRDCNRKCKQGYVFEDDDGSEYYTGMECHKKHWPKLEPLKGWIRKGDKATKWVVVEKQMIGKVEQHWVPYRLVVCAAKSGTGYVAMFARRNDAMDRCWGWVEYLTIEEAIDGVVAAFVGYCERHSLRYQP